MIDQNARFDVTTSLACMNRDGKGGLKVTVEEFDCSANVVKDRQTQLATQALETLKEQFAEVK